jgi:hypothetical protein
MIFVITNMFMIIRTSGYEKMYPIIHETVTGTNTHFNMQSYPPKFLDALLEATNFLNRASTDESMTKADVCASMETRLSLLVGKMVSTPMGASFTVFNNGCGADANPSETL